MNMNGLGNATTAIPLSELGLNPQLPILVLSALLYTAIPEKALPDTNSL